MDKDKIFKIIRAVVFMIILCIVLLLVSMVYLPWDHAETSQSGSFYKADKNTIDVLLVGSSTIRAGFSPDELWHEYGMVAYTRADSRQCSEIAYLNVKDSLYNQKPKVVILGITQLFSGYKYKRDEPFLRKGLDHKRFTIDKLETIGAVVSHKKDTALFDYLSYIFTVLRYHSRWSTLDWDSMIKSMTVEHDFRRGQYREMIVDPQEDRFFDKTDRTEVEVNENSWKWYRKVIELCNKNDIKVIAVATPDNRWTYGMYTTAKKLIEDAGGDYIEMNKDEVIKAMDIDLKKDFYNPHHLNLVGCKKATKYLGGILRDEYQVPQWKCSEELAEELDNDYVLYTKEYNEFLKDYYYK